MDKSRNSQGNGSYLDQNSLGILNMENLKVFGDLSSFSKSGRRSTAGRETTGVHERLRAERMRAMEALEKPRPVRPSQIKATTVKGRSSTNISELVTDETIDLNSSGSFALATPAPKGTNISFEPAEITGRSTLCQAGRRRRDKENDKASVSVADILKSSFVEKARLLEKKLQDASQVEASYRMSKANSSILTDSFNCSRSLPRTADLSDLSLNGGGGFSFGSASAAAAQQELDESFAPAELMQSKLVLGEISWAQEFTAMPTATMSNQAMQKIAAPPPTSDIETSVSNSVLAGDPDFSLGNYFQTRSENIWNIVNNGSPERTRPIQPLTNTDRNHSTDTLGEKTPQPENRTYTKPLETNGGPNLGRNLMRKMQHERIQTALKTNEPKRPPSSSEILSLSAIDKALKDLDLNSDTSTVEVVNRLWEHGRGNNFLDEEEDKENHSSRADGTLCGSKKLSDTMSFTDSVLNSTDFRHLQKSISRKPLSPLADQPQITISRADTDPVDAEAEADIDEWPSTPVKDVHRRVRRTKISPRTASPSSSDGVRPLTGTEDENENEDEDKTPVNKKRVSVSTSAGLVPRKPSSLSSTRLDGCDVAVASSTERDFGISPSLGKNLSPMSSPRSCLSSPLLDSTTSSERRQLMNGAARKANSSPAGSEASSISGSVRRGPGPVSMSSANVPRSMSRCSNSSEFSHRDGKLLPLKVTHTSLCWGSTKLRTDVRKSMQVKNTADKRLVIRLGIQGPGFQLVGGDSATITLQAMECRSVVVNFCPTVCGAAIGTLSFYAPPGAHNCSQPGLEIPLYGYGGSASIAIQGLLKGPVGASFLTIGDVCELSAGPLSASLRFHNKGPLTAFVGISVDSTVLMKLRLSEAFEVRPSRMILPPNSEASVQILFRPNREDLKNILKKTAQVITLANMRIFCGDEPNRQRMRSLVQRMNGRQREKLTSPMLDSIWSSFPDEQPVRNIGLLNEPPEFILDLVTVVRIIDVALTLNRDFDESAESSLLFLPDADETVLFRTICAANSPTPTQSNLLEPVDELLEADTTTTMPAERNWSVQPGLLDLDGNGVNVATLTVINSFRSRQLIEVSCSVPDLVRISPIECYVAPDGGKANVEVCLLCSPRHDVLAKEPLIVVSMENERITVPLSFKF
ncbi:hypothetical protein KR009_010258 [Drosophila setifemur]|nr:hypothetical protein KR009_010258 [Drosophila setifemur]